MVTGHDHNRGKHTGYSKRLQAETSHRLVLHAPWAWGLDSVSVLVGSCSPSCITTSEHTTHYTSATYMVTLNCEVLHKDMPFSGSQHSVWFTSHLVHTHTLLVKVGLPAHTQHTHTHTYHVARCLCILSVFHTQTELLLGRKMRSSPSARPAQFCLDLTENHDCILHTPQEV